MSYRTLAVMERSEKVFYADYDLSIFVAVILELAHSISRGRHPSSSCLLNGVNLREWLQKVYIDVPSYKLAGYKNYCGEPSSLADAVSDDIYGYSSINDLHAQKIARAIALVGKSLVYPRKLEGKLRGDPVYQRANNNTSLKRKRRYWEDKQGSWYDSDDIPLMDCNEFDRYPSGFLAT